MHLLKAGYAIRTVQELLGTYRREDQYQYDRYGRADQWWQRHEEAAEPAVMSSPHEWQRRSARSQMLRLYGRGYGVRSGEPPPAAAAARSTTCVFEKGTLRTPATALAAIAIGPCAEIKGREPDRSRMLEHPARRPIPPALLL